MTRLAALLFSIFALAAFSPSAYAQDTDESPYARMPDALVNLVESSYRCQAVIGDSVHAEIMQTVRSIISKLAEGDEDLTSRFMAAAEAAAQRKCPDAGTCWRDYVGADASMTKEQAVPLCEQKILPPMELVSSLLTEIIEASDAGT